MTKTFFGDAGPTVIPPATGPIPVHPTPPSSPPAAVTPTARAAEPVAAGSTTAQYDDASVRRIFARRHKTTG